MVEIGILDRLGLRTQPQEEVRPDAADGKFLSDVEIKDAAVVYALRRVPFEEALKHFDEAYMIKERGVEAQYTPALELATTSLEGLRDNIRRAEKALEENNSAAERLGHKRLSLFGELQKLRLGVYVNIQEIRKLRLQREKELFETEDEKLKRRADANYDQAIQDLNRQIEIARTLYDLDRERWGSNEEEYKRRADELKDEKRRVEAELDDVRRNINQLKRFGITRHTAGFLIWAGYVSLAGVGGVIANLLSDKPAGATSYISLIFQYLTNIVGALQATRTLPDFWHLILRPCIVVLIILAVTGGLVWVADFVLRKFVKHRLDSWGEDSRGGRRARRKGRGALSPAAAANSRMQPPFLTPETNRLSINLPEVDRRSYVKLLALLPYLFLAFVIVLLSVIGSSRAAGVLSAPTPSTDFSLTYVGVVFALLTVSVSLLYATKVIEPRWRRLSEIVGDQQTAAHPGGDSSGGRGGFRMFLRAHWEFIAVIGAMVLALVVVVGMPNNSYRPHAVWSAVAIFMCFSSLAFAYGIIQRGLFRSEDFLDRRRDLYRRLIEKYSMQPAIPDVFETVNPGEVKEIIDNYRQSRQDLDELRLFYKLKRHFADNHLDDKDILRYWSGLKNWADPFGFLGSLSFRKSDPTEPDLIDYEIAPEETTAVNQFKERQAHIRSRLEEVSADVAKAERLRADIKSKLRELESEMKSQEARRVALEQSRQQEKARLQVWREADYFTFEAAFRLGEKVAEFAAF